MDSKLFNSLKTSKEKSIVVFSASWCGPCKVLAKTINTIFALRPDLQGKIHKVDIDDASDLSLELGIQCLPTVYYLGNGSEEVRKGIQKEKELLSWFD